MQYRKNKKGEPLSLLGYGCMRMTKKAGKIDLDKAVEEVGFAVKSGVNYFDTAYVYMGNEIAVGEIFQRLGCREKINIATKLPHYLIKTLDGVERMFQEELKRLQTDYIDYYLMHMLDDVEAWEKLKSIGVDKWIEEKKSQGVIRQIGFSYHGNSDMFCKLIDVYEWDFCQIQYNYMDENTQAGKKGLLYAASKGIPVIIMEPLRGGKLVDLLPDTARKLMAEEKSKKSPAEWAFKWLYNQPEVTCVLSGMNSIEMVQENVRIAAETNPGQFTQEEFDLLEKVKEEINKAIKVGCTGCGYCMPCPYGVDIPGAFRSYNNMYTENKKSGRREYIQNTLFRKEYTDASLCRKCGRCEQHCPQHIPIRQELIHARHDLETIKFKMIRFLVKRLHLWG